MRRFASLAVLALVPMLGAACGSGQSADSTAASTLPRTALAGAADATAKAGSARFALRMAVAASGQDLLTMTGQGGLNFGGSRSSEMSARYRSGLVKTLDGATMSIRMVGSTMYVRSPLFTQVPPSRPWVRTSLERMIPGAGALTSASPNPAQMLSYLRGVSSAIDRVGTERVRGVRTTHFRAVVDERRMLAHLPSSGRTAMQRAMRLLRTTRIPMDVWIDGGNRVRRVETTMSMSGSGLDMTVTMRMEYFDFGAPVKVTAPAAGEVSPVPGPLFAEPAA